MFVHISVANKLACVAHQVGDEAFVTCFKVRLQERKIHF